VVVDGAGLVVTGMTMMVVGVVDDDANLVSIRARFY
jgi:hypothetical protein